MKNRKTSTASPLGNRGSSFFWNAPGDRILAAAAAMLAAAVVCSPVIAAELTIAGPVGSQAFGTSVRVLPNRNIVVTDPHRDSGRGAAYLYSPSRVLISTLNGTTPDDHVGSGDIVVLANGNYLILSPDWDNGGVADAGAVTFGNASTGVAGNVSAANSLVGSTASDKVGATDTAIALTNGNYVVRSPLWNNGATVDAGAATFCNGTTGQTGTVSVANSVVGSHTGDKVGADVTPLGNGNYVVHSPDWSNGVASKVGAATWGDGSTGTVGTVSSTNSLVGSATNDGVGASVTPLSNNHYVVSSPYWDKAVRGGGFITNAGAATWGNGAGGTVGVLDGKSLTGATTDDRVGMSVTALDNGNYVVASPWWNLPAATRAGAVTWLDGTAATVAVVSSANSLVGSTSLDLVGQDGVTALSNGHYVVGSAFWNGIGAATWGNGTTGTVGTVSTSNSLTGSTSDDGVGFRIIRLGNGNYAVGSPLWDRAGIVDAGAATWGDGTTGTIGTVSSANSLVGSTANDRVGWNLKAISDGTPGNSHYVVMSEYWDNWGIVNAGAATWSSGTGAGPVGVIKDSNSLVGGSANDYVGTYVNGVVALSNGHYVVASPNWQNGAISGAGAATWGNGAGGTTGVISELNSIVGTGLWDHVGLDVYSLGDGRYAIASPAWDAGAITDAGAMTLRAGTAPHPGVVSEFNSVRGAVSNDVPTAWDYDSVGQRLVVGRPAADAVVLFNLDCNQCVDVGVSVTSNAPGDVHTVKVQNSGIATSLPVTLGVYFHYIGLLTVPGVPSGCTLDTPRPSDYDFGSNIRYSCAIGALASAQFVEKEWTLQSGQVSNYPVRIEVTKDAPLLDDDNAVNDTVVATPILHVDF
jgi:hypothetical protein